MAVVHRGSQHWLDGNNPFSSVATLISHQFHNMSRSCESFTDRRVLALGVSDKLGTRNAPTILIAAFVTQLFWDGRTGRLEEQAKQPLLNAFEMGMGDDASVVSR
jgi:cytochrome c peroxidase